MKFFLILATIKRDKEVNYFLESLRSQTYKNFELIIVDQNKDNRIDNIIQQYKNKFFIKHIKIERQGLSLARNIGLKHIEREGVVAFPDDDCEYPPQLLENAKNIFEEKKGYRIITGISLDKQEKKPTIGKWLSKQNEITCGNIFLTLTSISLFIYFPENEIIFFDEKLGLGAPFGAAEERDYVSRLLKGGYKGFYYPERIFIYHPNKRLNFEKIEDRSAVFFYSLGVGAFFKKHFIKGINFYLLSSFIRLFFVRPIGGMILGLLKFSKGMFLYYRNIFIGRWKGLIKYPKI